MFDVGFWELCLIGLISLLVIGPERLPKVARITGFWIGKTRHMIDSVKQEIGDELRAEEIRQILKEQASVDELKKLSDETSNAVDDIKASLKKPLPGEQTPDSVVRNGRK